MTPLIMSDKKSPLPKPISHIIPTSSHLNQANQHKIHFFLNEYLTKSYRNKEITECGPENGHEGSFGDSSSRVLQKEITRKSAFMQSVLLTGM